MFLRRLLFWVFVLLTLVSLVNVLSHLVGGSSVPAVAWGVLFLSTAWAFVLRPRPDAEVPE